MSQKVFAKIAFSIAIAGLLGCAKADYYERLPVGPLSTLSADNDLEISEGQQKEMPIKLTADADKDVVVHWRIKSEKYDVNKRFKTSEGSTTLKSGQREIHISVAAADVDGIRQGDQGYTIELTTDDGGTSVATLTLKDVNTDDSAGNPKNRIRPTPNGGHDREMQFDILGQGSQSLVKVLLVIDNSYSMKLKQKQLADGIRSIAKSLIGKDLQFFLYTTSNDHDEDGRYDKRTTEVIKGRRSLHAPFQDRKLIIRKDMPEQEFEAAVMNLQKNILELGHIGSKNESALCSLQNILREKDARKKILAKGDDALIFILSDTDDHANDVPVGDCGGTVSSRKIISSLDTLLGRGHYGVTAVISQQAANRGHQCGNLILDEGTQYVSLVKASPTPAQIFSICAKDYSEALETVNVFSRQSNVNEFKLNMQIGERVIVVELLRKGGAAELTEEQFEVRKDILRISQKHLQAGDRIRVVIRRR
ncbi:MAG: hypothetical protein H7326_06335 [Bdellovibrionaceae bacterium]|nr:hypothetical protein [Pseudobdellovibrionaceae bacterium]